MVTVAGQETLSSITLQVQNLGSSAVYCGGVGLTSSSYGVSIVAGGAVTIDDLPTNDEVYALSSSGDSYVAVLRVNR
jgi:hypothetical protein